MRRRISYLADVKRLLYQGWFIRHVWKTGEVFLQPDEQRTFEQRTFEQRTFERRNVDGRSYHGFLDTVAPGLTRTETGSTDTNNLITTWRKHAS